MPDINAARLELMRAIDAGLVVWTCPPGVATPVTTIREGRRTRAVTAQVNWLRSHGLAQVVTSAGARERRQVRLTAAGRAVLESAT